MRLARRILTPDGRLPRRGYTHCFIEEEGVHSRLHLHHFYSLFLPDISEPVDAHLYLSGADGRILGVTSRRLLPFSSLTLPVADLLREFDETVSMGTVAVDIQPASSYERRLVELGPEGVIAQSPFWMGYFDDQGSVAYIHSIDQYYGAVFGVGRLAGLAYRARWERGGSWASKRLIDANGLRSADAYLVNHSSRSGRTPVRWRSHPDGRVLTEQVVSVAAHGVARVRVTSSDLRGARTEKLRLEVDDLLTANGKPYVMVRYGDGPFSLHHG